MPWRRHASTQNEETKAENQFSEQISVSRRSSLKEGSSRAAWDCGGRGRSSVHRLLLASTIFRSGRQEKSRAECKQRTGRGRAIEMTGLEFRKPSRRIEPRYGLQTKPSRSDVSQSGRDWVFLYWLSRNHPLPSLLLLLLLLLISRLVSWASNLASKVRGRFWHFRPLDRLVAGTSLQ